MITTPPQPARAHPVFGPQVGRPMKPAHCIAFEGMAHLATGRFADVAVAVRRAIDAPDHGAILVFDAVTSELHDVDTRGSADDVARRYAVDQAAEPPGEVEEAPAGPRSRGRPKLGVVAREVTLLPRHWEWLASQPGGASVALRKLVEEARRANAGRDAQRQARESAYRFMSAIASGFAAFEEATRALFAGDRLRFTALVGDWPVELRQHLLTLAEGSFAAA